MTTLSDGGMAIYFRGSFPKGGISKNFFPASGFSRGH